jgi:hypothetical protein
MLAAWPGANQPSPGGQLPKIAGHPAVNDLPLVVSRAEIQKLQPVCLTGETGSCHNALSGMDQLIPFLIVFALGFAAGYGVRE